MSQPTIIVTGADLAQQALDLLTGYAIVYAGKAPTEEDLVALCRSAGVVQIDCQQATQHLASLGAAEMPRDDFLQVAQAQQTYPAMHWQFSPHLWATLGLPTYD